MAHKDPNVGVLGSRVIQVRGAGTLEGGVLGEVLKSLGSVLKEEHGCLAFSFSLFSWLVSISPPLCPPPRSQAGDFSVPMLLAWYAQSKVADQPWAEIFKIPGRVVFLL